MSVPGGGEPAAAEGQGIPGADPATSSTSEGQPGSQDPPAAETVSIAEARALQAANDRLRTQVSELEGRAGELSGELERARGEISAAEQRALEVHRRALLAEHPNAVAELVQGTTVEELEASVANAEAVHARIADAARADTAAAAPVAVPAGAPGRASDAQQLENAPAIDKIARGLQSKS